MEQEILIKSFIGKNSDVIYSKMNKKGSFNIYSMLFTSMYFLYRKMYLIGIISSILQYVIAEFVNNIFVSLACFVIWGFAFYPLYKMHVNRKVEKITAKEFIEEDIKKKGGTSIGVVIIIPVILVVVLLASIGTIIMNSAMKTIDNNYNNTTTTNASKYYSYNGAKIKYGNEWQEENVEFLGKQYKALGQKNGDIVIISWSVANISDETLDYSLSNVRQQLYDEWINKENTVYSDNGILIIKQTNEFKKLFKNLYYAYYEVYNNIYFRNYTILNSSNSTALSLMVVFENPITDIEEEKIIEMLKTVDF